LNWPTADCPVWRRRKRLADILLERSNQYVCYDSDRHSQAEFASMLASVKDAVRRLRGGLRPSLTDAALAGLRSLGRVEEQGLFNRSKNRLDHWRLVRQR
jgi:hypothetical protein